MTLLTETDYQRFPAVKPDQRFEYGTDPQQFCELTLPRAEPPHPVIVLAHGGCYRAMYDLKPLSGIARSLADAGFAVWNIEYRRAGNGGDYPNMFLDVGAAADSLQAIADRQGLDLSGVISLGHSAGGHLALWLAGRHRLSGSSPLYSEGALPIAGVVALAAVADIGFAFEQDLCSDALPIVMGSERAAFGAQLRDVSPRELLPLGAPQIHIVGDQDEVILANVRQYLAAAEAAGEQPELITLEGAGHFEAVAVEAPEWQVTLDAVRRLRSAIQERLS